MSRDASEQSIASTRSIATSDGWRLPGYLGANGKAQMQEIFTVLREELSACQTAKETEVVWKIAEKIASESNSGHFSISGRLAFRLREAMRSLSSSSSFSALDGHYRLAFRKVLKCEVRRRQAEIIGWDEHEAEAMALQFDMIQDFVVPPLSRQKLAERPLTGVQLPPLQRLTARVQSPHVDGFSREPTPSPTETAANQSSADVSNQVHEYSEHIDAETASKSPESISPKLSQARVVKHLDSTLATRADEAKKEKSEAEAKDAREMERWKKAFMQVRDDNAVHRDDMAQALEFIGFLKPDKGWIEDSFAKVTKFVTVNEAEFVRVIRAYKERQRQAYWEAFQNCDADRSGTVEASELVDLLSSCGIVPMDHVLEEVITEVDNDRTGNLEFSEFEVVMEILRAREGFTKHEHGQFVSLFKRHDRDNSGEIDARELIGILSYLGFAFQPERVEQIVKQVDFDGSGKLNEYEFLSCVRQIRESEVRTIMDAIDQVDEANNGVIHGTALRHVMTVLGYQVPDMDAVWESAKDAGIDVSGELDLSKLWRILVVFRAREGFSAAEASDVEEAFKRYDKQSEGEISTLEAGKVLRWLGYTPAFEVQQQLVTRVDIDGSGMLNLAELRKLLRMLQSKEMETIISSYSVRDPAGRGLISINEATLALFHAGCVDSKGLAPTFSPEQRVQDGTETLVAFDDYIRVAMRFKRGARRAFRENCGFSDSEIAEMRECFRSYDRDGSGDISSRELIRLIEDIFPEMAHSALMRPKLAQLMQEVDADGSGSLDFQDFMRLMQQLQELQNQEKMTKEHRAIKETGFSQQEISEFRELFLANDAGTGSISFQKLTKMLAPFCPLGDKNVSELSGLVRSTTGKTRGTEGFDTLDFPGFVILMHRLMEINFANIRSRLGIDANV